MKKFLCDQMCGNLGKWLRIAGYDTILADPSWTDREIFELAVKEDRLLLTKDRHFLKIDPERKTTIYLQQDSLDEWAQKLAGEGIVDWLHRPFSRCLHCNASLEEMGAELWKCPLCQQLFWIGSHTERMLATLKWWNHPGT